jgi:hypothetical protein
MLMKLQSEKLKGGGHLEGLSVVGKIILKRALKKQFLDQLSDYYLQRRILLHGVGELKKQNIMRWTGSMRFRIGSSGGVL